MALHKILHTYCNMWQPCSQSYLHSPLMFPLGNLRSIHISQEPFQCSKLESISPNQNCQIIYNFPSHCIVDTNLQVDLLSRNQQCLQHLIIQCLCSAPHKCSTICLFFMHFFNHNIYLFYVIMHNSLTTHTHKIPGRKLCCPEHAIVILIFEHLFCLLWSNG